MDRSRRTRVTAADCGLDSKRCQGPMPHHTVSLNDVSFTYSPASAKPEWILQHVDLDVRVGEFICLLGPSGCGKSTLLQLIAGFLHPTVGSIHVNGHPVYGPGPDRAVVSQQPTLYPWLTVLENVCLPLQVRGTLRRERIERGWEALRLVGLETAAHLLPHQLSGGMTQRLMVARALIQEPAILLLDESLAALDALAKERLQCELLYLWHRTGATVLMVTHDVEEAALLATRVLVMTDRPGRLCAEMGLTFGTTIATNTHSPDSVRESHAFLDVRAQLRSLVVSAAE